MIIGGRELKLPILVPSISSYETPVSLTGAISIQFALQEPISLVSAFDFHHEGDDFRDAVQSFNEFGVLLVDSGGYESQRIQKLEKYYMPLDSGKKSKTHRINWTEADFFATIDRMHFSLAFSYDYFGNGDVEQYQKTLTEAISRHMDHMGSKVIPVVHAVEQDRTTRMSESDLVGLCSKIAKTFTPQFIAVPERELGSGMAERARLAKKIVSALRKGGETRLHILGCGNPLSSAIFSAAGVAMVDGLEWCRTYFCQPMWLSHFQHEGTLPAAGADFLNLGAKQLLKGSTTYEDRVAIHNLAALQKFGVGLTAALLDQDVPSFLRAHYGDLPAELASELLT